jgi:VanZ family protein
MRRLLDPRIRAICFALWCVAWLLVAIALLMPLPVAAPSRSDLVAHFATFGLMALGAVGFCHQPLRLFGLTFLTMAGAAALEFAQLLSPYRSFDLVDMIANMLGALCGYGLALALLVLIIRPADAALRGAGS